ncbi:hypothetical protein LY76DRAFT_591276 [Colletotrichum caudatum]|nr:hypothetical protein LY76DRAFT_591276 [Colletotrichum caudatum]
MRWTEALRDGSRLQQEEEARSSQAPLPSCTVVACWRGVGDTLRGGPSFHGVDAGVECHWIFSQMVLKILASETNEMTE